MNPTMTYYLRRTASLVFWVGILHIQSCQWEQISDPGTTQAFRTSRQPVILSNANGQIASTFYDLETLFVDVSELDSTKQYCIEIARPDECEAIHNAIVLSDSLGIISTLPMLFDIGFDPVTSSPITPGEYEVRIQGHCREPFINFVVPFTVEAGFNPAVPTIIPTLASGEYSGGTLLLGDDLYARGANFPPSTEVHIYVVEDRERFDIGDLLSDLSVQIDTVFTTASGRLPNTLIWARVSAAPGTGLDLVGDLPPFGEFDASDTVREIRLAGTVVQNAQSPMDIIQDLARDVNGNLQDFFEHQDIIKVKVDPVQQTLLPNTGAAVYIVNHQDMWLAADPLVSVIGNTSHEMPNFECLRLLSASKDLFPMLNKPGIPPGRYDVVIDVGRNAVYDPGVDILDGGPQVGLTIAGEIDSVRAFFSTDVDFLREERSTTIYAKAILENDSTIVGAEVTFEIIRGPGTLSTNFGLTNEKGIATTVFTGGGQCSSTLIKIDMVVPRPEPQEPLLFTDIISIWVKDCLHNQGRIGTDP